MRALRIAVPTALAASLAMLQAAPARAAAVVAVLSADHGVYRQALDGFQAAFGSTVPVRLASADVSLDPDTRVVLAIGGRAALRSYPPGVAVVFCLVPPADVEGFSGRMTRVRMVPKPEELLARIRAAQPHARALAVLWSQSAYESYAAALVSEGARTGLKVLSLPGDSSDLPRALRLVEGRADAIWLAPDPLLVTPANFRMISAFAALAKVPFYAPASDLVAEGATAAVSVSPERMGRAAADAARRILAGEQTPSEVFADGVELIVKKPADRKR